MNPQSQTRYQKALRHIPGGVNSPVRAFGGVGGEPIFFASGQGAYLTDTEGRRYIDYVGSWGPLILGHAEPSVVAAVQKAAANGMSFGAPTDGEVTLAAMLCNALPSIDQVRLVNSGTEATMSALRLARGYTGRNKIIKFVGCYHGHVDALLVKAGSGTLTFGQPTSLGIPKTVVQDTLLAEYNDLAHVKVLFEKYGTDIAAVIVEPIAANMNLHLPEPKFLTGLRALCDQYESLLIFDEVITGFRVGYGGAQVHYGVTPDLTTLGKIIGGGMSIGAFGGRHDIMQHLSPVGPVYQAGTLSGNPVAVAAGIATLSALNDNNFYTQLHQKTQRLAEGINECALRLGAPLRTEYTTGLFGLKFDNMELFRTFFHAMLKAGIYLAPSAYEVGFISASHSDEEITRTLEAVEKSLRSSLPKNPL